MNDVIDEVIKFRAKPNVFLYAFEASRFYLVLTLGIAFAVMPLAYFKTGLPIGGLMLRIVFSVYAVMSVIFLILVILLALCVEFIVTNKRAIVRVALVRVNDNISIPLETIRTIEVRSYSARYGSVYFDRDVVSLPSGLQFDGGLGSQTSDHLRSASFGPVVGRARRVANLIVKPGRAWLSMPSTSPGLSGFYGFRQFETFANLILELQATA
jgi:hypothetical protein